MTGIRVLCHTMVRTDVIHQDCFFLLAVVTIIAGSYVVYATHSLTVFTVHVSIHFHCTEEYLHIRASQECFSCDIIVEAVGDIRYRTCPVWHKCDKLPTAVPVGTVTLNSTTNTQRLSLASELSGYAHACQLPPLSSLCATDMLLHAVVHGNQYCLFLSSPRATLRYHVVCVILPLNGTYIFTGVY